MWRAVPVQRDQLGAEQRRGALGVRSPADPVPGHQPLVGKVHEMPVQAVADLVALARQQPPYPRMGPAQIDALVTRIEEL